MRVGLVILLNLIFSTLMVRAQEQLPELKVGTNVYHNVTILSVSHTDIMFSSDSGMANAKLKNLDPDLQTHFHYKAANGDAVEQKPKESDRKPLIIIESATPAPVVTSAPVATPAVATPAVVTPAVATPAVATPAVATPAVATPAVATPAVATPAVVTPAVATPAIATPAVATPAPTSDLSNIRSIMDDAMARVKDIVNQPVKQLAMTPDMQLALYKPGWFREGASKPNFNTVDVRATQETGYGRQTYVSSDLNPGVVFLGDDLEFNPMTKYFYVDYSLPKKKLTEAEMLEINRLYRIIGQCEEKLKPS